MKQTTVGTGLLLLLIVLLIVAGCSTDKYSMRGRASNYEQYQYKLTLTFLSEEMLIERFSEINNPFLSPQSLFKDKDFTTFELVIENDSPDGLTIQMPLETVSLVTSSKTFYVRNQFKLSQFWYNYPDQKRGTARKMQYVVKENVFENVPMVKSGETESGLLVFQGKIQKWGEVELYIPLFTERNEFIEEHVELYEF